MTLPHTSADEPGSAARRAVVMVIAAWGLLPLSFFATGGWDPGWWEAWVYCGVLLAPSTVFVAYMARRDPAFIARRSKVREKEPAQRRIMALAAIPSIAVFAVPGFDHRFGWSEPPPAIVIAAMVGALLSYLAILRVFIENRWAGRTIETYAGQQVIATGAYALVRHPLYAAGILLYLATPVALGSWWGLIPALADIPIFVLRIRHEERVLLRELPGYDKYRRKVRYRLVPFVW